MKRVISTSRLVQLFSYVIFVALTSAKYSEGLKNAINSHSQRHRESRRLNVTAPNIQSRPANGLGRFDQNDFAWCGAVQTNIPDEGGTFKSAKAQWLIPDVGVPPDGKEDVIYGLSTWVGIDGVGSCPGILQAGTISWAELDDNGDVSSGVNAFAQWYPLPYAELSIDVEAGDTVQVSILASSLSQGEIEINNLSTGKSVSAGLASPNAAYNLCGLSAEWIVEDPTDSSDNSKVPFPEFSQFLLNNCQAATTMGQTVDLTGASLYTLVDQNNKVLASPSLFDALAVQVTYVN